MRYDLAIIGGGPAGYTAAERAAKGGLKTLLIEKNALGGVCLNEGCIPTKTLLYSAKVLHHIQTASKYAVSGTAEGLDLGKVIARKGKIIRKLTAGIRSRLTEAGVEMVTAEATVTGRQADGTIHITAGEVQYEAAHLLLCTGSETFIPPIPGVEQTDYWTNREALQNKEIPASLVVIGGGVIGMEFASFFNSIGTEVHVVEMMPEILNGIDPELAATLRAHYEKEGVKFYLGHKVTAVRNGAVTVEFEGETKDIEGERILMSVGRRPVLSGFEQLGLELAGRGVKTNEKMQTSIPNVYAAGDITGFSLLAHTAVREAEVAVDQILGITDETMSYRAVPGVVYTNPEVAGVGETEESLRKAGRAYT
ncbi:dihydrolipoyl dehydrogenase family protein, partial [Porphyromonas loveana]|uniref:dihydrolipoyl dehydrogenase family protein n=1 Tax=Porphyromonas loveana TaxID=1884669 RepID=UPI00359FC951